MSDKLNWKNRIIGHGEEPLDAILFNPSNWRIHPKEQQEALEGVLSQVGWVQDVIINKHAGNLIDGHLRCQVAARNNEKTIPVVYVDLSAEEENLILASLDPIAAMAATDKTKLDDLLQGIQSDDERIIDLLNEISEKENLEFGKKELIEDVEPQIDKAEELRVKWGVQTSQLWGLGDHRLVCGDCTDKAVVERVMGGEKADLVFTDPPYGIDYSDVKGTFKKIENDGGDPTELIVNSLSFVNCNVHYICCNWKSLNYILNSLSRIGNPAKAVIVWDKGSRIQNLDKYGKRHEFIAYAGEYGGIKTIDDDLWQVKRETRNDHPTARPVELIERAISHDDGIVYDPFLGSGTTLIACERLNRKCRAIEISEGYVGVALQRYYDVTGVMPVLLENNL